MKGDGPKNLVASVQARLVERSRELGVEHQLTLARFGGERLLYRLSTSEFADRFILKGAALLLMWLDEPIRPTKDIDLLGFGDTSAEALKRLGGRVKSRNLSTVQIPQFPAATETGDVLLRHVLRAQVGVHLRPPAPWSALEDMGVMQQAI